MTDGVVVVKSRGVDGFKVERAVPQWRKEGESRGAGEEVHRSVFDEVGAFAMGSVVGVVGIGRRGGAEFGSGNFDGEFGEGFAEEGLGREGAGVHGEGECGVPAGDVLGEEFAARGFGGFATEGERVVDGCNVQVVVFSWLDVDVSSCGVAED